MRTLQVFRAFGFFLIATVALLAFERTSARADTAEGDAWNTGSVFAAAVICETRELMTRGQAMPLLARILQGLSAADGQRINYGYQEGLKRRAVYSKNNSGWFQYPVTAEGCSKIAYAISQYKAAIDTIVEGENQHYRGGAREEFVSTTARSCMSGYGQGPTAMVPRPLFEKYCRCYAEGLAGRATIRELKDENPKIVDPIIKEEGQRCYAEMKAEAIRGMNHQ